jgi:cytochrome P450
MLGNLKVLGELMKKYPPDSHPQSIFTDLARDRNYQGIFYMDLYPFSESLAIIIDPELATQVQHSPDFHRHPFVDSYLGGLVGTKSVFSTKGTEWQRQRAWFSPAFSLSHLLTLIPGMIEECLVFKEKLTKYAVSGEVFSLNNAATLLTIDVIARSVGDLRLKSQTEHNEIQVHFSAATSWTAASTAPWWQRLRSRYMLNYHTKKLDKLLGDVIKEKYSRTSEDGVDKSILDLALKGYMKDSGRLDELKKGRIDMNKDFMKIALDK